MFEWLGLWTSFTTVTLVFCAESCSLAFSKWFMWNCLCPWCPSWRTTLTSPDQTSHEISYKLLTSNKKQSGTLADHHKARGVSMFLTCRIFLKESVFHSVSPRPHTGRLSYSSREKKNLEHATSSAGGFVYSLWPAAVLPPIAPFLDR